MNSNFELSIQRFFLIQVFKILPLIDDLLLLKLNKLKPIIINKELLSRNFWYKAKQLDIYELG